MEEHVYRQFLTLEKDHWWFRGRRAIFAEMLDRHAGAVRGLAVDVGCGFGGMLEIVARHGDPVAVDLSADALRTCVERGYSKAAAADAEALPFRDKTFSFVGLFDGIEHVADEGAGMAEAFRVLEPGGTAIFTVPAYEFLYADNDRASGHVRRYTKGRLLRALRSAGFEVVHASYYNAILFPLIVPAILAIKLKEALRPVTPEEGRTNISYALPRWLNESLFRVLAAEARIAARWSLPFGHSLAALVRRPRG